jgi:tRNA threonylcarbamoyladenosine biosynthesis protein TsaB
MSATKLLAIETSSATGSVALAVADVIAERTIATPREQIGSVLGIVDELLTQSGLRLTDLDAIVFGQGPGSFTGLRIAAAIAQGLSLGSGRPIVPVSSLAALAARAFAELAPAALQSAHTAAPHTAAAHAAPAHARQAPHTREFLQVLCCVDARMGEVYSATYAMVNGTVTAVVVEAIGPPGAVLAPAAPFLAVGDALAAHGEALAAVIAGASATDPGLRPRAQDLLPLAAGRVARGEFVSLESALPLYLRESGAWRSW